MLEAKAAAARARANLILVTDAALVLKTSGKQALVYFCNALDGSPLANGKVKLWERWHDGNQWLTREQSKETGADGIAVFDLSRPANNNLELFASAIREDRQAFSAGNSYWYGRRVRAVEDLRLHRPARLSPEGNRELEIHRAALQRLGLFHAVRPDHRI